MILHGSHWLGIGSKGLGAGSHWLGAGSQGLGDGSQGLDTGSHWLGIGFQWLGEGGNLINGFSIKSIVFCDRKIDSIVEKIESFTAIFFKD